MAGEGKSRNAQAILWLIGLTGVLGAALIANWAKISAREDPPEQREEIPDERSGTLTPAPLDQSVEDAYGTLSLKIPRAWSFQDGSVTGNSNLLLKNREGTVVIFIRSWSLSEELRKLETMPALDRMVARRLSQLAEEGVTVKGEPRRSPEPLVEGWPTVAIVMFKQKLVSIELLTIVGTQYVQWKVAVARHMNQDDAKRLLEEAKSIQRTLEVSF